MTHRYMERDVSKLPKALKGFSALDNKKHGVGGLIRGKIKYRAQDKRAEPGEFYAVVFFPRIHGIGNASLRFISHMETLSQSPAAAKAKYLDRLAPGQKWADFVRAGHRIRKIRLTDLGDAA
jgi:hypothetical protein